jgi:putative endonuclease
MNNYVYILECSDKTLYTGTTNNIAKRIEEHNKAKSGAKYTRSRRPVKLVYVETCSTLSAALKREAEIKKLSRAKKMQLISASNSEV